LKELGDGSAAHRPAEVEAKEEFQAAFDIRLCKKVARGGPKSAVGHFKLIT
jgi:hypothetical protein